MTDNELDALYDELDQCASSELLQRAKDALAALRAEHKTYIQEIADLSEANDELTSERDRTQKVLEETVESMGNSIIRLEAERDAPLKLVAEQAEDEGLWFMAQTAPEAYLQQELRKLHAAIEGDAAMLTGKEKKTE